MGQEHVEHVPRLGEVVHVVQEERIHSWTTSKPHKPLNPAYCAGALKPKPYTPKRSTLVALLALGIPPEVLQAIPLPAEPLQV